MSILTLRTVLIRAFPKAQVLDIAGPIELFNRVAALRDGQAVRHGAFGEPRC